MNKLLPKWAKSIIDWSTLIIKVSTVATILGSCAYGAWYLIDLAKTTTETKQDVKVIKVVQEQQKELGEKRDEKIDALKKQQDQMANDLRMIKNRLYTVPIPFDEQK